MDLQTATFLSTYLPPEIVAEIDDYLIAACRRENAYCIGRIAKLAIGIVIYSTYVAGIPYLRPSDYCKDCGEFTQTQIYNYRKNEYMADFPSYRVCLAKKSSNKHCRGD